MNEWLFPLLAGAVTGVLSGFGVGGGTLLLVYMTVFAGLDQHLAQGINLLYFLPASGRGWRWPLWQPGRPPPWTWRSCASASGLF